MSKFSTVAIVASCAFAMIASGSAGNANSVRSPAAGQSRTLSFADRVAYQYAIEEVYWRHRIWPKENPGTKPPLDAIVSQHQIEQKVEDYLRKSQLVTDQRGMADFTASELQAEIKRMSEPHQTP